jgi:hypothetical protein
MPTGLRERLTKSKVHQCCCVDPAGDLIAGAVIKVINNLANDSLPASEYDLQVNKSYHSSHSNEEV